MIDENFIKLYEKSFKHNWELPALTDYKGEGDYSYGEMAEQIAKYHILFEQMGIKKGDKIALIGRNQSSWCIVFMATITYGAVIVPILSDFHPDNMLHILEHSESKLLFVESSIWENIDSDKSQVNVFILSSFKPLRGDFGDEEKITNDIDRRFKELYPKGFSVNNISYADVDNNEIVCLNYTSGTTGFSKGVMLTGNNYVGNIVYAQNIDLLHRGERVLAFLPMAHAYGCAFDFLYSLSEGVHINLLGRIPSAPVLLKAFDSIRPNLIVTVPLIFEKIYKKKILPQINKPIMKAILKVPVLNGLIYSKIRKSLIKSLGGNFSEVIIGGAAFNKEVESFLYKIKFPFTVGYGMTECAPLISHDHHTKFVPTSCGTVLKGIMEARIDSSDPTNKAGEIQIKGKNVMKGYYKNPEATAEVFTTDGWLKTGDLGVIDEQNRLYIRGRAKTMILGANGQNIYPEEIESKLNNMPYVSESLVVDQDDKLVALVYPDHQAIMNDNISEDKLLEIMTANRVLLNESLSNFEKIIRIILQEKEFEKTPKKSIKRYLYLQK